MSKMKKVENQPVVVASFSNRKQKLLTLFATLGLALIVAGGILYAFKPWETKATKNSPPADSHQKLDATDKLQYSGKKEEAITSVKQSLDEANNAKDKGFYAMQLATLYESNKDYKSALSYYRQVEALNLPQYDIYSGVARCSEAMGDKTTAIEYYKKAYNNLDSDSIVTPGRREDYKWKIESLGGKL
jgi:tetratricopeptide (TPR) repeat protein